MFEAGKLYQFKENPEKKYRFVRTMAPTHPSSLLFSCPVKDEDGKEHPAMTIFNNKEDFESTLELVPNQ